ncbi:hypothetical protein [Sporosarcina trichiuri]|uniref:hypothetical protein n=1 Tax=Sporosarcina trichiuri TaxID=3056445 RepID=UPI0025B42F35|nr:hypothetical protein [Sporosarcina sp. 0.2-SM1T-5]WJY28175.1 hypothetical protein QWT68_04110 [Sporosarcina sp. 0.2-SM1T-5]
MRSLTKRQKDLAVLILSIIFFLLLAAYSWYQLYAPAREANEQAVSSLADQREVLFELQRQVAAQPEEVSSNSRPLQQKVPVLPLEEQLLVQLEKAEVKSRADIRDVQFIKGEAGTELTDPAAESSETVDAPEPSPETAIQVMTVDVELTASDYSQVDRFIREIEKMERIFIVQSIELTPPEEQREVEEETVPLELTLSFQAFYRPDLTELFSETPKLDAPDPAGKDDPTARQDEEDAE